MPACAGWPGERAIVWVTAVLLGLLAVIHLYLALRTSINWDEFNFLAGVHALQDGRATVRLNNLHATLYAWLTAIPGSEIDRILVARVVQFGLFAGAMVLLYRIGRLLFPVVIALIVVFLAASYTDVLRHTASFRFDPICLFFSMLAVYVFVTGSRVSSAILAGLALAISLLVSVKTVFLAVPLGLLGLHAAISSGSPHWKRLMVLVGATVAFAASIQGLRVLFADPGSAHGMGAMASSLERSGTAMFLREGFLPKADYLVRGISRNGGHWLLLFGGILVAVWRLRGPADVRRASVLVLCLVLPLASVLIYRNAFAYFYVYVLPPALLAAGLVLDRLTRYVATRRAHAARWCLLAPVLFASLTAAMYLVLERREGIADQEAVVDAVHRMFPDPVPYIGAYGVIASFPRHGPFMSTWGMRSYRERGQAEYSRIIREHQPKFLLRVNRGLVADPERNSDNEYRMFPEDWQALQEHYLPHWGPVHVAGRRLELQPDGAMAEFELLIGGVFRLESEAPVRIDDFPWAPGDTMQLAPGIHRLTAEQGGNITLRLDVPVPEQAPPEEWLWDSL